VAPKNEVSEPITESPNGSSSSVKNARNEGVGANNDKHSKETFVSQAINDVAILPKGTLDPVYEAKARVLNHAVRSPSTTQFASLSKPVPDSTNWHGMVSMAAVHCCGVRLGM